MGNNGFNGWALVELMGHRKLAGWVTEAEIASAALLAVELPSALALSWWGV